MNLSKKVYQLISKLLKSKGYYLNKSLNYKESKLKLNVSNDYIRYATLELCKQEILLNNVSGNIAELGVYKGDFAKRLNEIFDDRKLYLFDTFEGFVQSDINKDVSHNYSNGNQNFSDTSINTVLKKMKYPENCIVKKGFFPDTAADVNDTFCFVNIDTDLYQPILNGLEFFYPRLEKKGFIFIHDFNNDNYKGARQAVVDFCFKNSISYTPIPDSCGTVVITK
jgi:O-methyltransferase